MSSLKICPQCGADYELDQRFCPKDGTTLRLQNGSTDLVGSIAADRYHVLRKLGEGGMGQVYLAEHVKMGRKSALEVMNPALVMRREPGKVTQSGNVTPAGQAPSDVSPPRDSTRYAGPIDSSAFRSRPAADPEAAGRVSAADVSERLDSLEKVVSGDATPAQAEGVLRELHQMRGRIRGNEQIVQAGIVEAFAQSTRHHQAEACAALRRIEPAARGTRRANNVTTAIAVASCP